mmetsp:Transcript_5993/g.14551  ORF Transcript_5993/g.14551 Transcript_5993/m.14551 type:complete len:114 (-) Transcript_5993:177-518(-)
MSGEYLRLSLKDGSTVEGYLYCRDPESGNVVIFNGGKEEKPHPARMVIVMKHAIHNESVSVPYFDCSGREGGSHYASIVCVSNRGGRGCEEGEENKRRCRKDVQKASHTFHTV